MIHSENVFFYPEHQVLWVCGCVCVCVCVSTSGGK